jgi:hypothetical protein
MPTSTKRGILPKYVLVGYIHGQPGPQTLAANDHITALRYTKSRSGWDNDPNIKIYQLME